MFKLWNNLLVGDSEAERTVVFSGGASNEITFGGARVRGVGRDKLNALLDAADIPFFDPQIHKDTHGRDYAYSIDGPAEKKARANAQVLIYQIGDETISVVTVSEIREDVEAGKKIVILFTGMLNQNGKPVFDPRGIDAKPMVKTLFGARSVELPPAVQAHLAEYVKAGSRIRAELVDFLKDRDNVVIVKTAADAMNAVHAFLPTPQPAEA